MTLRRVTSLSTLAALALGALAWLAVRVVPTRAEYEEHLRVESAQISALAATLDAVRASVGRIENHLLGGMR